MKNAEMLYAMECYGDLPTRQGQINKALQELVRWGDFSPEAVTAFLEDQDIYDITGAEYTYIRSFIERMS